MIPVTPGFPVAERIQLVRETLPDHVRLIAVTKTVPVSVIREAYSAGVRDFGESRIQEAQAKRAQLQDLEDVTWHLIGHLQRNKVKPALELFSWIHSVDSLMLAQRLDHLARSLPQRPNICLQVKVIPDPNKYGWNAEALRADLHALQALQHLQIQGLMSILPMGLDQYQARRVFQQTRTLAEELRNLPGITLTLPELSMGMSGDYRVAVKAGATMVRLGRVLFGQDP